MTRHWLAIWIVGLSVASIALTAGLAIGLASSKDRSSTTRLVFTSMLPLFGTWVGTVLAFYFARENLNAATESTLRLARRLDPGTPVRQEMIPREKIEAYELASGEDPEQVRLSDLYARMRTAKRRRIPIIDGSGAIRYVVHDSTISGFANQYKEDPGDPQSFTQTLGELLRDPEFGQGVRAIGFVGQNAVLGDARERMRSIELCNDVFVTESGNPGDPVVGWLTNTDLAGLEQ